MYIEALFNVARVLTPNGCNTIVWLLINHDYSSPKYPTQIWLLGESLNFANVILTIFVRSQNNMILIGSTKMKVKVHLIGEE